MLAKKQRLTTAQFDQYFKTGTRVHGTYVQLIYSPAPTFHGAAVAGKKVSKKAPDRNRCRRRIYNALYSLHKAENLTGVYICIAKPAAARVSYTTLKDELTTLIKRVQ